MPNQPNNRTPFIEQAENFVLAHLSEEQFGVSELADLLHMSRSNLLRKIKKETHLSASQFIRQIRLREGKKMVQEGTLTVSEISYQVGFSSTSYFIKCFREHYGYPPGELAKGEIVAPEEVITEEVVIPFFKKYKYLLLSLAAVVIIFAVVGLFFNKTESSKEKAISVEKSIAVLPFKNESSDSTNLYFVNGLMEATLNNLQRIEDLRVVSRTSVEKYRSSKEGIPAIANELQVNYVVEGSGQRIGNQVLLHIQLVDASTDTPIWVEQYKKEVIDVFDLQNEVAKQIAKAIQVVVTPAELAQIEKKPTENMEAYDLFLQGLEPFSIETPEGYKKAIPLFKKAIEKDPQFALAYGDLAICYYSLDVHQAQKQYTEQINNYADKALLYDATSDVSLIAKAFYYMHTGEYRLALPHLEKALEYNPNSSAVIQVLSGLYSGYLPDTAKYLKYALLGAKLQASGNDSISKSYMYLHLSNALAQSGFVEKASTYISKSLQYNPNNYYAPFAKVYIDYAKDKNLENARTSLLAILEKDSSRLDVMQALAQMYYYDKNYKKAYEYYAQFVAVKKQYQLAIYPQENLKITKVYAEIGLKEEAEEFYKEYANYCKEDKTIYKSASTAMLYAYDGKVEEAMKQLKLFSSQNDFQYWVLLFLEKDPLITPLQHHPDYNETIKAIQDRFWNNHKTLQASLEKEGLM